MALYFPVCGSLGQRDALREQTSRERLPWKPTQDRVGTSSSYSPATFRGFSKMGLFSEPVEGHSVARRD